MSEKIVVSMTSYPGRITNVGKSIYLLLTKQTKTPEEIHLWLAEPEFINKEKDLPTDLVSILEHDKIYLHWLPKNTYCHKRHEIFKYTTDEDCVFLIDDDVRYNDKLIETVMNDHQKFPNAVINYNGYSAHVYKGRKIIYTSELNSKEPTVDIRFCGQSMIPAKVYPKEVLTEENKEIRDKICPVCDESWFTPWLVYHNVPVYCERFGWGVDIDPKINKWKGLCNSTHEVEANGYEKRDNWLFAVLSNYDFLMKAYQDKFGYLK